MTANQVTLETIARSILGKYRSLESPDFSFVQETLLEMPYKQAVSALTTCCTSITEDTDLNEDVSFGYLLSHEDERLFLQLSMVARYAVLLKVMPGNLTELVSADSTTSSTFCRKVLHILHMMNIDVLTYEILVQPVNIRLFNTNPADSKVYQVLFTDRDTIPWSRNSE